jgi:membrane associated rhomboid family serine protease
MLPLHDDNPTKTRPYVTWSLIAINIAVFVWQIAEGYFTNPFPILFEWGEIPLFIGRGEELHTMVTSMFLHGDPLHIGSNMLFLYVFGDNVEDRFGHGKYLILYLAFGIVAGLVHSYYALWVTGSATFPECAIEGLQACVPAIGASGAVSGILGAYFIFWPRARIVTVIFLFYFIRLIMIPAVALLGFWFFYQVLQGLLGIGGGVAVWAHIGGFVAGLAVAKLVALVSSPSYETDVFDEYYY